MLRAVLISQARQDTMMGHMVHVNLTWTMLIGHSIVSVIVLQPASTRCENDFRDKIHYIIVSVTSIQPIAVLKKGEIPTTHQTCELKTAK